MIESLDVMLWSRKAGTLVASRQGYENRICFYFDDGFVRGGYDIAPLRAPLNGIVAKSGMPVYPEDDKAFGGLPSFIADSLPDHWGNTVFREWARERNISQRNLTALDRLAYIGRRGMGALEFVPPTSAEMETPFRVEIDALYRLSRQALAEARNLHAAFPRDFAIESLFKVGTSAGGRRPKAVINVNMEKGEFYSGQVEAPELGFVPMIIKFDECMDCPSTRIEYSYYLMASDAGLNMMRSELLESAGATHFLTERFDRRGAQKIHVQTLAALDPLAGSYESLFETALRIGVGPGELRQIFLAMTLNVLGGNVDDHSKNFSFLMGRDGVWHFAPVYDFTFTVDLSAPYYVNRHSLSVCGKTDGITKADLLSTGVKFNIKGAESIIDRAADAVRSYRRYALKAGVTEEWIGRIEEEIESRLKGGF